MIIKRMSIGNKEEAYIEDRFIKGINIITSDDNNKGKTIVIQSMMYALGNEPVFPSSLNYKDYYHTVEFEINNQSISICRKDMSFIIYCNGRINIFDNRSEFKHYLNKNIFKLPVIIKDGYKKIVDPLLFYQIFFVGQDKKDTSNIMLSGYYNKNDFMDMLYSYYGIPFTHNDEIDYSEIKQKLISLKTTKKELLKRNKILKAQNNSIKYVSKTNDKIFFDEKISNIEKVKEKIVELNKQRNKSSARKIKNEIILKELRSLNQTMSSGAIQCLECGSKHIGYATADKEYIFDVSSNDIRKQILSSIEDKISSYDEDIQFITQQINTYQNKIAELLSDEEINLESLLVYKQELIESKEADEQILAISKEMEELEKLLGMKTSDDSKIKERKKELKELLIKSMNQFYKFIDIDSNSDYSSLFTKQNIVYSGVEGTEFYLSKLYSFLKIFQHNFPIVMDSYRAAELSSKKEKLVLEKFNEFANQIIFTSTLKDEELGKYDDFDGINHIDYSPHKPYKLLLSEYVKDFKLYCKKFLLEL